MSKYDNTTIIERFKDIHGDEFTYDLTNFVNTISIISIYCKKHGKFKQAVRNHLFGQKCRKCRDDVKRLKVSEVLAQFIKTHGNLYSYDKMIFKGMMKSKIIITCSKHGDFEQLPHDHSHGRGCMECWMERSRSPLELIIQQSNTAHNNTYDYSSAFLEGKYIKNIVCSIHGLFCSYKANHIKGHGCRQCGIDRTGDANRDDLKLKIDKAKSIHGEKYDYSLSEIFAGRTKTLFICKLHGVFQQLWNNHLFGQGCPKCKIVGRYTTQYFERYPERISKPASLYIVKMNDGHITFFKIGISISPIKRLKTFPYQIEIIFLKKDTLINVFNLEQHFLKTHGYRNRYTPNIAFGGDKECFILPENDIVRLLLQEL